MFYEPFETTFGVAICRESPIVSSLTLIQGTAQKKNVENSSRKICCGRVYGPTTTCSTRQNSPASSVLAIRLRLLLSIVMVTEKNVRIFDILWLLYSSVDKAD